MSDLDAQIKEDSQVTWIKSHPEKRADKKDWNEDDRRIAIADDVASGHHRLEDIENEVIEIPLGVFLRHIQRTPGAVVLTRRKKEYDHY